LAKTNHKFKNQIDAAVKFIIRKTRFIIL